MSASTRTVQQPLGTGQLWVALAVVTLAFMVALAIAFGARGIAQPDAKPAPIAPPAVIDHGWSQAGTNLGAEYTPVDHGSSESSMYAGPSSQDIDRADHGARDDLAAAQYSVGNGFRGDPGLAPRTSVGGTSATSGNNGPQLRPR